MSRTVVANTHHQAIANNIKTGEDFRNGSGSFSGQSYTHHPMGVSYVSPGWLSPTSSLVLAANGDERGIDYVIRSYATPIAYRLLDGTWIVPTDSHSVTTARHQSHVWSILRKLGISTYFEWVPDISAKTGKPLKTRSHREQTAFRPYATATV